MKKILVYTFFVLCIYACTTNPVDKLQHLSGYWEIESVVLQDGSRKNYSINETIDYIQINDSIGFRKKMKPLFNGTYETSDIREKFELKMENDSLNLYYSSNHTTRKETILNLSETQLKIVNQNNITYLYKRYIPLTIE